MAAILSDNFRVKAAQDLLDTLALKPAYVFTGKDSPWTNDTTVNPINSTKDSKTVIKNLIQGKRIFTGNMSLVINRYDWVQNTVYDIYDDEDSQMFSQFKQFYVMTDTLAVYKCLSNNNGGPSTIKPTGSALTPTSLADKYVWKYMFTVPAADASAFSTSQYIPVKADAPESTSQHLVRSVAIAGGVQSYKVTSGGTGYSAAGVTINGDGTGATGLVELVNGEVSGILVSNPGSGYTYATATITGDGIGAIVRPIMAPSGGHGYNAAYELGAHYTMIKMDFGAIENTRTVNDYSYRQVGIIANILDSTSLAEFSDVVLIGTTQIGVPTVDGINVGEDITLMSDNTTARVVGISTDVGNIITLTECRQLYAGEYFRKGTGAPIQIVSVNKPDIAKHSGDICYIENRSPITKNATQTETVRIIIEL